MKRQEKIKLLTGIQKGVIPLKTLLVKQDPFIIDETDSRPVIQAIKENQNTIVLFKGIRAIRGGRIN